MDFVLDNTESRTGTIINMRHYNFDVDYHVGNRECKHAESVVRQSDRFVFIDVVFVCLYGVV